MKTALVAAVTTAMTMIDGPWVVAGADVECIADEFVGSVSTK
jgi:hypothetical protein